MDRPYLDMGIPYTVQLQSMASSFVGWMRKSVAVMMALFLVDLPIKNCVVSMGEARKMGWFMQYRCLVGGLEHEFYVSHILGIIIPTE